MPNQTSAKPRARLALADGRVFSGQAFGATGKGLVVEAEIVFNTALTGYQESLTDPSYSGQILVQTTPLIGNTGVNGDDTESKRVQVSGFVVHELTRLHSNFRATNDLSSYLAENGVLGLAGVDTRAMTRVLRTHGVVPGVLTDDASISDADLVARARAAKGTDGQNLVPGVGCKSDQTWSETLGDWGSRHTHEGAPKRVVALDCGAKSNILRHLRTRGCELRVVPHDITPDNLARIFKEHEADGLFVSNGPGDPAAVNQTIEALRAVVGGDAPSCPPTFGICLGHQLLALALGAKTFKLPFGHRGTNQPVLETESGTVAITSQNHGYAVTAESIEEIGGETTHLHLNDETVAGFRMKDRPVFAVQYHPEASPGPHDASVLFDRFVSLMGSGTGAGV